MAVLGERDLAADIAARMQSDPALCTSGKLLGITAQDLIPLSMAAFQVAPNDSDKVLEMRHAHHERARQELAKELLTHHETLLSHSARIERATSAGSLRAPKVSSASTAKLLQEDAKLLETLRRRRQEVPGEWLEARRSEMARRQEASMQRQQAVLEAQRQSRQRVLDNQHRAHTRVDTSRREEFERAEEARQALEERMRRAALRKAQEAREHEAELYRQRKSHDTRCLRRSESLRSMRASEQERATALRERFGAQEVAVEEAVRRRQADVALRAERSRLLQQDHQGRRDRAMAARLAHGQILHEKHRVIDERLGALDKQRRAEMRQRKSASVISTLRRQAIIINSRGEWQDRLRWTPLPEDPQEIPTGLAI